MKIMFAAGDVGGARAILPVAQLAHAHSHDVTCLAHGTLLQEGSANWRWLDYRDAVEASRDSDIVIYATSVSDNKAVELASTAQLSGVPCLHVLDNWSSYSERIQTLLPQGYAVMDELAFNEAVSAGVPDNILHVTGHPDLAKLAIEGSLLPGPTDNPSLLFVSEPATNDGANYDESLVTERFIAALIQHAPENLKLKVAPHPREVRQIVEERMETLCANLTKPLSWSIVGKKDVRKSLHSASHVVGMSSILLYESWLLGLPTLSLQPSGKKILNSSFTKRAGLLVHSTSDDFSLSVAHWLSMSSGCDNQDLFQHTNAATSIMKLAVQISGVPNHDTNDICAHRQSAAQG